LNSPKLEYLKYYSYQGRKISKKISVSKKNLIKKIYNQYSLDESILRYHNNKELYKKVVLPKNYEKVNIEIGFGNGEFLIKNAISYPKELFIGVEVYLNGIAKVLTAISEHNIGNIILSNINSFYFLEAIPNKSVDKIFIINPDPWIKKRHHKRRLMSYETLRLLCKIVKLKNSTHMTTDSETYLNYSENLLSQHRDIVENYSVSTLSKNDKLYGISRYQRKAIEKGGKIYLLTF
tara:strand:+ start:430 stop:1134 length:705 start_codon:yes stop_codon:yes gene_type:complete